jgi:transcriptional regulator with XRE-family HTH domain
MSEVAARFGANLARQRERAGITQEELSFGASLHRTEIGLLERGGRIPRIDTLAKLAGPWECPRPACSTASTGSRASSRAAGFGSGLQMRPAHDDDLSQP